MLRTTIAFVVATLAVPVAYGVILHGWSDPDGFGSFFALTIVGTSATVVFLGWPTYVFLQGKKWTAFWIAPLAGFMVATVALYFFLLLFALLLGHGLLEVLLSFTDVRVLWPISPMGAVVGILVWLIARPDRSTATSGNAGNADNCSKR